MARRTGRWVNIMPESVIDRLSDILAKGFDDMPGEAIVLAKEHIFDTLAVGVAGAATEAGRIMIDYVQDCAGSSIVIGAGRAAPQSAALANGTICHVHDYDDDSLNTVTHPSPVVVPAVLALAEQAGSSGRAVIAAYVAGVQAIGVVSDIVNLGHYSRGWHATGTLGVFGAAAGAASILGLDRSRTRNALAIAASCASGLQSNFGTMTKPLHAGHAAQSGVMAAQLAARGFTGNRDAFDDARGNGFMGLYCGDVNATEAALDAGRPLEILTPGVNFKYYPNCSGLHSILDCALAAVTLNDVRPDQVARVEAIMPRQHLGLLHYEAPVNLLQARFSVEFSLASAIAFRSCGLDDITESRLVSDEIRSLSAKVERVPYDVSDKQWPIESSIRIHLNDGRVIENSSKGYRGHVDYHPFSRNHHIEKLRECIRYAGRPIDEAGMISLFLDRLEDLPDIREATTLLAARTTAKS